MAASAIPPPVSGSFFWMKSAICWTSNLTVCLIVDANAAGEFLAQPSAVSDWLLGDRGNPRLVADGKLRQELVRLDKVRQFLAKVDQAGRLRSANANSLHP